MPDVCLSAEKLVAIPPWGGTQLSTVDSSSLQVLQVVWRGTHGDAIIAGYSVLRPMLKMNCNFSPQRGASTEIEGETIDESDSRHRATMVCFVRSLILSINTTARFPFLPSTISLCGPPWTFSTFCSLDVSTLP